MKRQLSPSIRLVRAAGACLILGTFVLACGKGGVAAPGEQAKSQGDQAKSQVQLSATGGKIEPDGKQVITIKMQVNKGWHAYANPVQNPDYEPNKTEIKIAGAKKLDDVSIAYPVGTKRVEGKDAFQVYEGNIDILATVKRAAGDSGPLEVTVTYSVCNDNSCLPAETVKIQVK